MAIFVWKKDEKTRTAKARIVTASRSGGGMPKISLPRSGAARILLGGERSIAICVPRSLLPPTENPLRPWRPSLFPLSSSSISLRPSSSLHSSLTLLPPPFLPPLPLPPDFFLLQPCHAFGVFGKLEGSRGTFWDQCRCGCPTSWCTIRSLSSSLSSPNRLPIVSRTQFLNFPDSSISAEIYARQYI